jgi:hypothetical protein
MGVFGFSIVRSVEKIAGRHAARYFRAVLAAEIKTIHASLETENIRRKGGRDV